MSKKLCISILSLTALLVGTRHYKYFGLKINIYDAVSLQELVAQNLIMNESAIAMLVNQEMSKRSHSF